MSVLETVRKESRRGERASRVGLRIGEFAALDPDSLRFCFAVIVNSSDLAPLALEIEGCRGDVLQIAYVEFEEMEAPA